MGSITNRRDELRNLFAFPRGSIVIKSHTRSEKADKCFWCFCHRVCCCSLLCFSSFSPILCFPSAILPSFVWRDSSFFCIGFFFHSLSGCCRNCKSLTFQGNTTNLVADATAVQISNENELNHIMKICAHWTKAAAATTTTEVHISLVWAATHSSAHKPCTQVTISYNIALAHPHTHTHTPIIPKWAIFPLNGGAHNEWRFSKKSKNRFGRTLSVSYYLSNLLASWHVVIFEIDEQNNNNKVASTVSEFPQQQKRKKYATVLPEIHPHSVVKSVIIIENEKWHFSFIWFLFHTFCFVRPIFFVALI